MAKVVANPIVALPAPHNQLPMGYTPLGHIEEYHTSSDDGSEDEDGPYYLSDNPEKDEQSGSDDGSEDNYVPSDVPDPLEEQKQSSNDDDDDDDDEADRIGM